MGTVWVDFAACNKLPMPLILQELGILSEFTVRGDKLSGPCPLHPHPMGKRRKYQFSANFRPDLGRWLARCWGDCARSFDMVGFVQAMLGVDASHCRLWFADRADRFGLSLKKPKVAAGDSHDQRTHQNAEVKAQAAGMPRQKQETEKNEAATPPQGAKAAALAKAPSTVSAQPSSLKAYKPIRFHLHLDREAALPYLTHQRGISAETAEHFGLGIAGEKSKMFCGYVCAPVWACPPGEFPLGYIGRWPGDPPEGKPRYLLPADFPRDETVFNLHGALTAGSEPLILVESIFSVFWLHQAGYRTAIALFGSSLGEGQTKAILASGRPVVAMLDGDGSGQRGAADAFERLKRGAFVREVTLDEEEQPDRLNAEALQHYLGFLRASAVH